MVLRPSKSGEEEYMRKCKLILAGLTIALAFGLRPAKAGLDLNEVGAFLVFPGVVAAVPGVAAQGGTNVETFLTFTNTSAASIIAHVSFINGNPYDNKYCYECDFDVPLRARASTTLVLSRVGTLTRIRDARSGSSR